MVAFLSEKPAAIYGIQPALHAAMRLFFAAVFASMFAIGCAGESSDEMEDDLEVITEEDEALSGRTVDTLAWKDSFALTASLERFERSRDVRELDQFVSIYTNSFLANRADAHRRKDGAHGNRVVPCYAQTPEKNQRGVYTQGWGCELAQMA